MMALRVTWWISKGEQRARFSLFRQRSTNRGFLKWMKTSMASTKALLKS